ncbi:MAG: hypothetical protein ACP5O3_02315, partial [Candidatus Micrarchaeia archaeon]
MKKVCYFFALILLFSILTSATTLQVWQFNTSSEGWTHSGTYLWSWENSVGNPAGSLGNNACLRDGGFSSWHINY